MQEDKQFLLSYNVINVLHATYVGDSGNTFYDVTLAFLLREIFHPNLSATSSPHASSGSV